MSKQDHFGYKVKILSNAISQNMTQNITSLNLTGSQAFLLGHLATHRDEVLYAKDLGRRFDFSLPTLSGLLQRLEAKGFIASVPDPDDRRCKRIVATEKAIQLDLEIQSRIEEAERTVVTGFTEEEIQLFRTFLDRAIQNIAIPPVDEGGNHT